MALSSFDEAQHRSHRSQFSNGELSDDAYFVQKFISQPTSFLQKSSRRVSSEKNILNSSVESC